MALDTETTGLYSAKGDRILEIGAVELIGGVPTSNNFHQYINPQRSSHPAALKVHCITDTFLEDKPVFADIKDELLNYIIGAELLIYNAPFDLRFLNAEMSRLNPEFGAVEDYCTVVDVLQLARQQYPALSSHTLNVMCEHLGVNISGREVHGALKDAELLQPAALLGAAPQFLDRVERSN